MKKKAATTTKILTRDAKEMEIDASTILTFPLGFPGFEASKRFKLFHAENDASEGSDSTRPVYWLQSLDEPEIVFSVAYPARMGVQYQITLSNDDLKLLELEASEKSGNHVALLVVLSRISADEAKENPLFQFIGAKVKPNLTAPVVINLKSRLGMQKMLQQVSYTLNVQGS